MAQARHKIEPDQVKAMAATQGVALSSEAAAGIAAGLAAVGAAAARETTPWFEAEPASYVVAQMAGRGRK